MLGKHSVMRRKCEFDEEDGTLLRLPRICGGVDFGMPLDVVHQEGSFYVVRCKGYTAWAAVGLRRYYSTEYMLLEIGTGNDKWVEFEILKSEETKDRNWRDIRTDMSLEAGRLHLGEEQKA